MKQQNDDVLWMSLAALFALGMIILAFLVMVNIPLY